MASLLVDFEEGDFSGFDTAPAGTAFGVTSPAVLGTYCGEYDTDGTKTQEGVISITAGGTVEVWRIGFWLNLNDFTFTFANQFEEIVQLEGLVDGTPTNVIDVELTNGSDVDLRVQFHGDDSTAVEETLTPPQSGWFHVELVETKATNSSSSDGVVEIYIDNVQEFSDSTLDNFDTMNDTVSETISLLWYGSTNGASVNADGSYLIDRIQWNDTDTDTYQAVESFSGIYTISLAIDRETDGGKVWLTTWEDGTLYARQFDSSLLDLGKTSLGVAAFANMQSRLNTAYIAAGSDLQAFAYGNMVNPAGITGTYQLIETETGVTGSWSSVPLSWSDNDVLKAFHTTPELTLSGERLFSGVRWVATGSVNQLYQGTDTLAFVGSIPLATGSVKHGAFDVSPFYHIALGGDTLGEGANRVLGTVPPYSSWTDITNDYPSGTVDTLRFL